MFRLLYDPVAEIKNCKKHSYATILLYLIAASLFETVGLLFFAVDLEGKLPYVWASKALSAEVLLFGIFGVLFALIALHIVAAFYFAVAMHVLDGRGGFYEALAALVLAFVAPAISIFFGGALLFVPGGEFFAIALITLGMIMGAATFLRATKTYFEIDYAGVIAGIIITVIPLALAIQALTWLV